MKETLESVDQTRSLIIRVAEDIAVGRLTSFQESEKFKETERFQSIAGIHEEMKEEAHVYEEDKSDRRMFERSDSMSSLDSDEYYDCENDEVYIRNPSVNMPTLFHEEGGRSMTYISPENYI